MGKYKVFDPHSEVIGQSVLAFIQCVNKDEIQPFLKKQGLTRIEPDRWYPLQTWLDVLSDIATGGGNAMFDFVSVGMKISEVAPVPPEMSQVPFETAILQFSPVAYRMSHRGDAGEMTLELVEAGHIQSAFRTPYPDDFLYGIQYGGVRRFLPHGKQFVVEYDENILRRDHGGEITITHLRWW